MRGGQGWGVGIIEPPYRYSGRRRKMAEGSVSSTRELERVLEDLRALSGEVTTAAVLSKDGELWASTPPPGVDRERYTAMLAALVEHVVRAARVNGESRFVQARIGEEGGYILLLGLEGGETFAATTGLDARVGLVLYDMRNVRRELERILGFREGGRL